MHVEPGHRIRLGFGDEAGVFVLAQSFRVNRGDEYLEMPIAMRTNGETIPYYTLPAFIGLICGLIAFGVGQIPVICAAIGAGVAGVLSTLMRLLCPRWHPHTELASIVQDALTGEWCSKVAIVRVDKTATPATWRESCEWYLEIMELRGAGRIKRAFHSLLLRWRGVTRILSLGGYK